MSPMKKGLFLKKVAKHRKALGRGAHGLG